MRYHDACLTFIDVTGRRHNNIWSITLQYLILFLVLVKQEYENRILFTNLSQKHKGSGLTVMDKPLSKDDIAAMEGQLRGCVEADRKYWRVNDVKCDAIYSAKTYEEFADRVAAAHLQPLEKKDFKGSRRSWNQYASKENGQDE